MSTAKLPITKEQLKGFKKDILIDMVWSLMGEVNSLNEKLDVLTEKVNVLTDGQFGRQTESRSALEDLLGTYFNEAEVIVSQATPEELEEPTGEDIHPEKERMPHPKGSRKDMLAYLEHEDIPHELPEGSRDCQSCGGTLEPIGREKTQRLRFQPASFVLEDHYVYSYKCSSCGKIVSADRPLTIFEGSLATPSLLSGIATAKFANATPFDRMEQNFQDLDVTLRKQTMARWMIRIANEYFVILYERMKEELLSNKIIHADETTVVVSKDGRKAGAKSYMWVYTDEKGRHPVVIYEYQKTRASKHPKTFLEFFEGWLCCDGYGGYHNLPAPVTVCGCWVHARRYFANAAKGLKDLPHRSGELSIAEEAIQRIADMFHTDNGWKGLPYEERLELRNTELKEMMDSYFEWIESVRDQVRPKTETGKGITYSLNQKEYLLGVLTNPDVPLDNSEAERKIRSFVVSRKNFVLVDTIQGAEASAIMFSMSETVKANGLKVHEYFKYVLTEMPKYVGKNFKDHTFVDQFLPWSDKLPPELRKQVK
ncbi:MAG: IS66 family transposase [Parasporobacterium sp.]|nr:IS66 family transposase [Parasporobacterium sp.]